MATINPFQGPIDYSVNVQSPFEAALSGLKLGAAGAEAQAQAQAREKAKVTQTGIDDFFKKPATERNYADIEPLLLGANKQQFDALQAVAKNMGEKKLEESKRFSAQMLVALEQNPETAKTYLNQRIEAETDPQQKLQWQDTLKMVDISPKRAADNIELLGAGVFGKDWYEGITAVRRSRETSAEAPSKLSEQVAKADQAVADATTAQATATNAQEKARADAALATAKADQAKTVAKYAEKVEIAGLNKTNWDIKNLQSQIDDRTQKLNLDKQITQANVAEKLSAIQQRLTDIPEGARKLINESATQSATSAQAASQYNNLASRIESAQGGKGKLTSASQWFASQLGRQDAWTEIRNEYTRVRNSVAIKSLPPGFATDKDIELALKGIPPETSNAATLASFLRGTAKLQDIDSAINNAKTDWLSQNNGLLTRAKTTFIAGDYATKSGETFNDFAQRIVGNVASKYRSPEQVAEETRQATFAKIPTNQAPVAAPTQTSIEAQADAILRGGR
jgi:hypothetical protein